MIEVRPAKTKDDAALIEIMENEAGTGKPMTKEKVYGEIMFDGRMYYTAYCGGIPCGYCTISLQEFDNSILLRKLFIKSEFLEQDITLALMRFFLEEHRNKGYQVIWLYLHDENIKKAVTYEKIGFVRIENGFMSDEFKMAYKIQEVF